MPVRAGQHTSTAVSGEHKTQQHNKSIFTEPKRVGNRWKPRLSFAGPLLMEIKCVFCFLLHTSTYIVKDGIHRVRRPSSSWLPICQVCQAIFSRATCRYLRSRPSAVGRTAGLSAHLHLAVDVSASERPAEPRAYTEGCARRRRSCRTRSQTTILPGGKRRRCRACGQTNPSTKVFFL